MQEDKIFNFIRYANVWEDTDIALDGLDIKAGQVGAVVCSGGDNALAMLTRLPKKIYAFDVNKTQLFCMELKMAAIRNLKLDETKCLLGVTEGNRLELYKLVQDDLSEEAKEYFDGNQKLIEKGIIHVGKFEHYLWLFYKYVIPLTSSRKNYREFAELNNVEEQKNFYLRKINTRRFRILFQIFFGYKMMGKYGRDKSFFKYVDQTDVESNGADLKEKIEYGIFHTKNVTNPYLDYIANNNFTHAFPYYLRPEYYDEIRDNLDKIELVHGSIEDLPVLDFDFWYLSDIFEYMSVQEFSKNIEEIKRRIRRDGRILYWNMQNRRYIEDEGFRYDEKMSQKLFKENKAWFYRDLLIYEAKK